MKDQIEMSLLCPTCEGKDFEYDMPVTDDSIFKCTSCNLKISHIDMKSSEVNQKLIQEEATKEVSQVIEKMLKDTFGGLGNIKLR